jgi:hypothetical protein
VKVIVTNDSIEIYREDLEDAPGSSCREFAEWSMAWAARRLSEEIGKSIEKPGSSNSVLCD